MHRKIVRKITEKVLDFLGERRIFFCIAIIFRILLEFSYREFIFPMFEYAGFDLRPNDVKYIESWVAFLGVIILLPHRATRPSDYLVCLAAFAFLTPLLIFYGLADRDRWALYYVLFQFLILVVVRAGVLLPLQLIRHGELIARWLAYIGVSVATVWMIVAVGFSSFNLNFSSVYEYRENANKQIYSGLLGYVAVWATTVCGPLLLTIALQNRQTFLAFGMLLLYVFWFGMTSHKAVLFYPALVFFLYVSFKNTRALSIVPLGYLLLVLVSLVVYLVMENMFLSSMFVRRFFFVPSHLTFVYMDFFEQNEHVFWSNSILSWFIAYPYDGSVAQVIGKHLGDSDLWANNSFFSTGFMHAGFFGVVIYGTMVGLILKFLDSIAAKGIPIWMCLSIVVVPFNNLFRGADLTTTLLTHGLGFGLFMLYIFANSQKLPEKSV